MVNSAIYKTIFESFAEGTIVANSTGEILLLNKKAESLLGVKFENVQGGKVNALFEDNEEANLFFDALYSKNNLKYLVETLVIRARNIRDVIIDVRLQNISEDNEVYYYITLRDVTNDIKKDELLVENKNRLLEAYKLANIGIWEWDTASDEVFWSEEVYKIKGVDPSLPAYPFKEQEVFYTPESWELLCSAVHKTLETAERYQIEVDYVRRDGSIRNAVVHGGAKKDRNGSVIGLYGTVQDVTEKKKSEFLLLKNESNLTAIIENTTDAIWAIDKDRNIIYLNEVFKKSIYKDLGIRLEKGMNIRDELPDLVRESWLARFDEAFNNNRLEYEDKINLRNEWIYFEVSLNPILVNHEVVGVSVFARNITERKKTENALKESEAQLSELVNATIEGVVISRNGIIVNANKPISELLGYSQEELIGKPILNFVAKELKEKVQRNISESISEVYEHMAIRKDGTLVPVEIHGKSMVDNPNEKLRFTAIRDMSERIKSEQALRHSEEKYRKIFENIQDVYFQTDLSGIILEVSPSAYTVLGYTREDVVGTSVLDIYEKPEDRQLVLDQLLATGQVKDYAVSLYNKTGVAVPLSLNSILVHDKDGKPYAMEGTIRDISSRIKIEQEIKKQNRTLQIQNKELEQFTYVTSHDLQEPLRTLMSISELLSDEFKEGSGDKDKVDAYLKYIVQSAHRMQALVKGLLEFSRIGKEIEVSLVDCNELLIDVLRDLDSSVQRSNAKVRVNNLPVLNGYSVELRLLFQNIISNALKFRRQNVSPEIDISVQMQKDAYCFSIRDNGIGIADSDKDKIFIIFKRLHNRNDYEGTGIGLSHCKKNVELHGGVIWVESVVGHGSVFKFTIPVI